MREILSWYENIEHLFIVYKNMWKYFLYENLSRQLYFPTWKYNELTLEELIPISPLQLIGVIDITRYLWPGKIRVPQEDDCLKNEHCHINIFLCVRWRRSALSSSAFFSTPGPVLIRDLPNPIPRNIVLASKVRVL